MAEMKHPRGRSFDSQARSRSDDLMERKRVGQVAVTVALMIGILYWSASRAGVAETSVGLETHGEIIPVSVPENGQGVNNGYPDLFRDSKGNLWCVWVSARLRNPEVKQHDRPYEEGDMIVLRKREEGEWSEAVSLNTNFGVNFAPALAEDGAGNIIAVWSSRREGEDAIWWRRVGQDLSLGSEMQIPAAGKLEAKPSLASSADGTLWLAFQSHRNGSQDIVFYRLSGSGWQRMPDIAVTSGPEFRPRLAPAPDGSIWCAYDAYRQGKYRVFVRRFDPSAGQWDAEEEVPGTGVLDVYAPDVAADQDGRVWVTYARNEVEEHAYGLRGPKEGGAPRPTTHAAVREKSGQWGRPDALEGESPGWVALGDLPRVHIGSDQAVWVVWQRLPGHVDWKVGAAVYQGGRWLASHVFGQEEPVAISGPRRRADQRASPVSDPSGHLIFAYERGQGAFQNRDIFLREVRVAKPASPAAPKLHPIPSQELRPLAREPLAAPKREAVHSVSGERRQLYFGDLHNHILVDDGHQGSADQLFIMHRDRFGMDFVATTSHGDSNKLLISELAHNDLLTESMLDPQRFITIPGFEWTQGDFVVPRAGHRHVIYETPGGPLYRPTEGYSDSIREFSDLMSKTNGLLFAYHISRAYAGGTDWSYVNVKVEPAVEMCSSWGRFEYYQNPGHIRVQEMKNCSVQDAWRMGWRLGVIGGSDGHNLYGDRIQGLTGVYATELTRPAIFEAIRDRRCYATTGEPIVIDFRVNGHLMGSEITSSDGPVIEATAQGTRKLIAVEVVKFVSGRYPTVYKASIDGNQAKVWWRDADFDGDTFYYLRVTQEADPRLVLKYRDAEENPFPTEMAWSSPVWVSKK